MPEETAATGTKITPVEVEVSLVWSLDLQRGIESTFTAAV